MIIFMEILSLLQFSCKDNLSFYDTIQYICRVGIHIDNYVPYSVALYLKDALGLLGDR